MIYDTMSYTNIRPYALHFPVPVPPVFNDKPQSLKFNSPAEEHVYAYV